MRNPAILCSAALMAACQQQDASVTGNAVTEGLTNNASSANNGVEAGNEVTTVPSASGRVSRFTRLSVEGCRLVREYEESGGWERRCPAPDGASLVWTQSDAREDLMFGASKDTVGLNYIVGNGAFSSLGDTLDWRGPEGGRADALVVRVNVAQPDSGKPDISRLAVIKLEESPCVVAVIEPGTGQSNRARAIADGKLTGCLKAR